MKILIIAIIVLIVAFFFLFLWLIRPGKAKERTQEPDFSIYEKHFIAHRGLFDNDSDAPENTMPAFRKAVERGFAIELDVQRTRDGRLVVFHDIQLDRLTGASGKMARKRYHELQEYNILDSNEKIPLLEDVLKMVDGRVPIVIEIKVELNFMETVRDLVEVMESYEGEYCVESFNPIALIWYRKVVPDVIRGQLSSRTEVNEQALPRFARWCLINMVLNFWSKPDFIAYDIRDMNRFAFQICRKVYKTKVIAWTVKCKEDWKKVKQLSDTFIFDSFDPEQEGMYQRSRGNRNFNRSYEPEQEAVYQTIQATR